MARQQRTDRNPFVFDRPLEPGDLVDREHELGVLRERFASGVNTRLASPRDYGKTSLLRRALVDAEREEMGAVLVDLYGVRTATQAAAQIERAYERLPVGPLSRALAALRRRGGQVGLHTPAGGASVGVSSSGSAERALLDVLDLPRTLSEKSGQQIVVAFDEFQVALEAELDGLIRSVIQHHGSAVTYVFSGSHPGMMASLFSDRRRPFYGQAAPLELGALPREPLADDIAERFEQTGRDVGEALGWLLDLVDGHPQRAMLIAHLLWQHTSSGQTADEDAWARAYEDAWAYVQGDFEATWDALSQIEAGVMEAVASGIQSLTGKAARESFGLPRGSAPRDAARRLVERGLLIRPAGGTGSLPLQVVDPLLARWVASGRRWV